LRRRAVFVLAAFAVALSGCGGGGGEPGKAVTLPTGLRGHIVLGVSLDPSDGALFLSTDRGLVRIPSGAGRGVLVKGTFRDGLVKVPLRRDSPATVVGPNRLLGSGHPGAQGPVPQNLGLLISNDGGATWDPISLTGDADLHILRVKVGADWLYAYDFVRSKIVLTKNNGRTFTGHPAPGLISDLAANPDDLDHVLAATDRGPLISTNAGANWRPFPQQDADRFLWPAGDALYLFDRSGNVRLSKDEGGSASLIGTVGAPVVALTAAGPRDLIAVTRNDRIKRSRDGGRTWATVIRLTGG
jgi:hypothetical protein